MASEDDTNPERAPEDQPELRADVPTKPFLIVGIGASAGGLEALGELVRTLPFDHMAFIIVQHLSPNHDSALTQLLARHCTIEVVTAAEGMAVETNHVYVLPPNADLAIMHGVLHLLAPSAGQPRLPIDFFFRSLAEDQGPAAVGIVLSGTGTDGTFGLKAIKAAGGITFAQDPATAKFDGMPRSALSSGFADFCLPPAEMAGELLRLSKLSRSPTRRQQTIGPQIQEQLTKLFLLIRSEFGTDLSHYKLPTVERRVERRMTLHKIPRLEEYVRYVYANGEELRALYSDMLITVTSFFRDEDAFEALKEKVYPQLVARKETTGPIRVWVPACATGEEAYSIAITLSEFLEDRGLEAKIQIFGTDIDDDSIHFARRGVYPPNIALDVSPERLARYFVRKDGDYQICRRIRDLVVFSRQNILRDAPFSRIGLVSCRNVLIYLQPPAQKKVLRTLNYALSPTGVLMLGSSETVGDLPDLFSLIDRKNKLYARKSPAPASDLDLSFSSSPGGGDPTLPRPAVARPVVTLQAIADRKVLELHGPPGVVINEHMEILQFRGQTGPYLSPAPGAASLNLLRVARPELHVTLKRAIQDALASQTRITADVSFSSEGEPFLLRIEIVPVREPETSSSCLLVLFKRLASSRDVLVSGRASTAPPDAQDAALGVRVQELERELAMTKEYLQATIEEKETANEELKSSNEELQSSNEELQSTNEELETSKEEMQSTNEELTTVNDELQTRMYELSQTHDDLYNILLGVEHPVVIIGMDLRIRRYTASAERLFNFVPSDVGRSVQFLEAFCGPSIQTRVAGVIQSLTTIDDELLGSNQRWYALRIAPYKTLDHAIRGAVLSLVDIDLRKRSADVSTNVREHASRLFAAIGHPLLLVDDRQRVVWANDPYFEAFLRIPEATIGVALGNLGGLWSAPPLPARLDQVLADGKAFRGLIVDEDVPGQLPHRLTIGASQLPDASGAKLCLISIEPTPSAGDEPGEAAWQGHPVRAGGSGNGPVAR